MVLATCRNSLNTKYNDKGRTPCSVQLFTAAKPGLRTTGWEPVLWKKSQAVVDHKLNVLEAGYGTIKKKAGKLCPMLCSSLERPQLV